ncbi:MAG TPA: lipopolysaccharide biosynthesis protein [Anaerolineales bacterium]|nr:lipopolysaccharide biosynthesis protein [Anaerolineales bacterium]
MSDTPENKGLTKAVIRGTLWVYAANYSGKALVFLSTVILARLLTKADYGLAGYALLIISFLDVLVDLGVAAALIYYPDDEKTRSTAFWLNLGTATILFGLTWVLAPFAGDFFNDARAVPLTRAIAWTFPISALGNIHAALLTKHLTFKLKFIPDVSKAFGKGIISIVLAWFGFGAWALVLGQVGVTAVAVIAYWLVMPWRPKLAFKTDEVRPLLNFGVNIVTVDALGTLLNNVDYLFIGRVMGAEALGVYTLAFRIPELLVKSLLNLLGNVLFPTYSKIRDNPAKLKQGFLVAMRSITILTTPIALGLAVISRPLVITLFTEKWIEAVPVMSAIALYTLIRALTFNIGSLYKAQGRPDILTKLSLIKIPILVPAIWWAVSGPGTIIAVAWVQVAVALIAGVMNLVVATYMLRTSFREMLAAFQPALLAGAVMMAVVWAGLNLLESAAPIVQLVVGVLLGALVYGGLMWWFQREFVLRASSSLRAAFNRG